MVTARTTSNIEENFKNEYSNWLLLCKRQYYLNFPRLNKFLIYSEDFFMQRVRFTKQFIHVSKITYVPQTFAKSNFLCVLRKHGLSQIYIVKKVDHVKNNYSALGLPLCVKKNHAQFVYWPSEASLFIYQLGSFDGVCLLWASGPTFMYRDI